MSAAPKQSTKKSKSPADFLKERPSDKSEQISGKEIWRAATLKNETTRKVVGFLMLVLSVVFLISFISFFFTWQTDQSFSADGGGQYDGETKLKAANAMGAIGSSLAFFFMHNGFGLGAFAILPYMVLAGMYLLFDYRPFSLLRILLHTILFVIWFSLFLGYCFQIWFPLLGGTFGYFGIIQIQNSIGPIGSFLFLAAFAVVYSFVFLNLNPFSRIVLKNSDDMEEHELDEVLDLSSNGIKSEKLAPSIIVDGADDDDDGLSVSSDSEELIDPFLEDNLDDGPSVSDFENWDGMNITMKRKDEQVDPLSPRNNEALNGSKSGPNEIKFEDGFAIQDLTQQKDELVSENKGDAAAVERYGVDTEFDPKADLSKYQFPTLDLLKDYDTKKQEIDFEEINRSKKLIQDTLENYKIGISSIKASVGPTVTLYEIIPAPGVKISRIKNLEDDIALSLAALGIRIIAPIPGKGTIGIEVPNRNPEIVPMRGVLASKKFQECDYQLPVILGKTISNEIFIADLAKMPHLLMAGATGQGKSVGLNAILVSLLYKMHPAYVKFVLVDPKKVELTLFNKIERHFLAKLPGDGEAIITENAKVINTLNSLCVEMDNRYKLLQDAMVRNIVEYNVKFVNRKLNPQNGHQFLPYIVVVIDEVADLMMTAGKEIEMPIARIAQLARAIGIHLILATQRPSVNVITGMIKANFPARIAFRVTSKIDSRTILDGNGADQLIGKGDMLYSGGNEMIRLQCPFVDTPEVEQICDFIGEQRAYPTAYILPEVKDDTTTIAGGEFNADERDSMFEDAARVIVQNQVGSTSMIQRKLKIGYNRAGRLMDQLEDAGIVGPNVGSKPRQVLVPDEYALEQFLNNL
jgi:S-DNA-T family DNA segregation ATPase FtsK/SpoIIIE